MSVSGAVVQRLEQRAQQADDIILRLQQQVQHLRKAVAIREGQRLQEENSRLRVEVSQLKGQLIKAEIKNGVKQVHAPASAASGVAPTQPAAPASSSPALACAASSQAAPPQPKAAKKEKKEKPKKEGNKEGKPQASTPEEVDFRNLDLRIGKIINVNKHPDADSLYVEEVELGEAQPRTVVSGLVKHIPIEEMQDRMVVLCCNLKPAKMRGVLSQAMVMCASSPDKVEILAPPHGAIPGDRVGCEGYEMSSDFPAQMNPKKKIFERIQPEFKTNDKLEATYKGARWMVEGKGPIVASSMTNSGIK